MKYYISILFLIISLGIRAEEPKNPNIDQRDSEYLARAKFKLINGDIGMSEYYLNQIDDRRSGLSPIKKRYLALIQFIRGDYKNSNKIISDIQEAEALSTGTYYPQVCLLKILNALAINDLETLKIEQAPCMVKTQKFSKNDQYWLDIMIKLKLHDSKGITAGLLKDQNQILAENDATKLWLKTGLYLNREKDIINLLGILDESSYQSKRLREIIGFMYLRQGDKEKALSFVDDIDSANAENIKGNISLQKNEYEIAFGHFKLAMQKKQDSTNSLERSLPLSWLLNQYEDGLKMIDSQTFKYMDPRNKRGIKIAYLIKLKKYAEAEKELAIIMSEYKNHPPNDVYVMDSFLSIIKGGIGGKYDRRTSEDLAEKACKAFDGFNCWVAMKLTQWNNLGKTILRSDEVFIDKTITLDSMKAPVLITPLQEENAIDQHDIEELDSNTVRLK